MLALLVGFLFGIPTYLYLSRLPSFASGLSEFDRRCIMVLAVAFAVGGAGALILSLNERVPILAKQLFPRRRFTRVGFDQPRKDRS